VRSVMETGAPGSIAVRRSSTSGWIFDSPIDAADCTYVRDSRCGLILVT
jgi:hypothetical protein